MDRKKASGLSLIFVSNDDVMEHIINKEEVSVKKARKDKVQTLASTPVRPVRSSRKSVNYSDFGDTKRREKDEEEDDDEDDADDADDNSTEEKDDGSDMEEDEMMDPVSEVLLDRDGPLGTEVYAFKTPKRAGKMALVAAESVDRRLKKVAVKRKHKRALGDDGDDSDFSPGPSSDEEEEDDDKDDLNSDTSSERSITTSRRRQSTVSVKKDTKTPKQSTVGVKKDINTSVGTRRSSRRVVRGDVPVANMAGDYFAAHAGQVVTSDHTLSRLETPQMGSDQLTEALKNAPNSYTTEMRELFQEHCALFNKWMFHLSNDFNILLYGLGSKRNLLEEFRRSMLKDYTHIVINGYFPSLTVKSILNAITDDVIDEVCNHRNVVDQLDFIEDKLEEMDEPLFLIIHNIDGNMLRSTKVQSVLSSLAQISNVHILASMDHINAPLIWDQERSGTFRWLWYDATTFDAYTDETSYENSLLVQQSGILALSSLTHVLRSLTPNARGIFNILVEFQLEHKDDSTYNGMSFQELYQKCREAFLVNSDLTLRAQLTEFRDHKLIRSKKSIDGMELLSIPLDNSTLMEFQQQEEL